MKPGDLAQLAPALDMAMASKHACPLPLGHPERTVRIERGQTLVVIEVQDNRVLLHELGHVFMLAHSNALMSLQTRCDGGPLRLNMLPDHAIRALRQVYRD